MSVWSRSCPSLGFQSLVTALAVGSAALLMGCGGGGRPPDGGGNGGGTQICGSALTSTTPVLCGQVLRDGSTTRVSGVQVQLLNASFLPITTINTDTNGFFRFNNVSTAARYFRVSPPSPGFHRNTVRYNHAVYAYYLQNQSGTGSCVMQTGAVGPGDRSLGNVFVFSDSAPPPAPSGCPTP